MITEPPGLIIPHAGLTPPPLPAEERFCFLSSGLHASPALHIQIGCLLFLRRGALVYKRHTEVWRSLPLWQFGLMQRPCPRMTPPRPPGHTERLQQQLSILMLSETRSSSVSPASTSDSEVTPLRDYLHHAGGSSCPRQSAPCMDISSVPPASLRSDRFIGATKQQQCNKRFNELLHNFRKWPFTGREGVPPP